MLAAGHEPKAELGLVEEDIHHHHGDNHQQHEPVELEPADVHHEPLPGGHVTDLGGVVVGVHGGVHGLHEDRGAGGTQEVHGRAHQGLVRLEVDAGHAQQAGVGHAEDDGRQDRHDDQQGRRQDRGQVAHDQRAAQGADDHDTFKAQVDDAGMLRDTAAQGYQRQYGGEDEGVLNEQQHHRSPPFAAAGTAFLAAFSACFERILRMVSLMKSTNPHR